MNPDDMKILNGMASTIRKNGEMKSHDLWKTTNLSIWQFDKYRTHLAGIFEDIIYDRKHQKYISRNNISNFVEENLK